MTKQRTLAITLVLALLLAVTGTSLLAQEATETPTVMPPPTFTDGRISNTAGLGGLALYCVDSSGNTNVDTFDDGAITVWGVGDQKYIELTARELRGSMEIDQEPSVMEVEGTLTEEAPMMEMAEATSEPQPEATEMTMMHDPVLLARANTPNGPIGFFSLGEDHFALQGHDDKAAFFTYSWTGCSTGVIEHTTGAFLPFLEEMIVV